MCERDCPRLLKFHTELPHLDDASRYDKNGQLKEIKIERTGKKKGGKEIEKIGKEIKERW